jgi:hypothetical protein
MHITRRHWAVQPGCGDSDLKLRPGLIDRQVMTGRVGGLNSRLQTKKYLSYFKTCMIFEGEKNRKFIMERGGSRIVEFSAS